MTKNKWPNKLASIATIIGVSIFLGGCEKYGEIKGKFVDYPFKNQKIVYLNDNPYVPDFIKIVFLDHNEAKKFLKDTELEEFNSDLISRLDQNKTKNFVIAYGWGIEPIVKNYRIEFDSPYIFHQKIYFPNDPSEKIGKTQWFTYSWGYNQGGFVSEFLDVYIFNNLGLKSDNSSRNSNIRLGYTFQFKATYDFEVVQRWQTITGNIEFEAPTENVTSNEIIQLPIR